MFTWDMKDNKSGNCGDGVYLGNPILLGTFRRCRENEGLGRLVPFRHSVHNHTTMHTASLKTYENAGNE